MRIRSLRPGDDFVSRQRSDAEVDVLHLGWWHRWGFELFVSHDVLSLQLAVRQLPLWAAMDGHGRGCMGCLVAQPHGPQINGQVGVAVRDHERGLERVLCMRIYERTGGAATRLRLDDPGHRKGSWVFAHMIDDRAGLMAQAEQHRGCPRGRESVELMIQKRPSSDGKE